MSINDFKEKINPYYTLILLLVTASIFFALGRLSVIEERKGSIRILNQNSNQTGNVIDSQKSLVPSQNSQNITTNSGDGSVIGSKSGKKYYYPWCSTVKRIKPENQVRFASIEEAKSAGFTAGGNCAGLK